MSDLEWIQYGKTGVVWFGEINGQTYFQISLTSDGTYFGMISSPCSHYGILEKAKELGEAQRFCSFVARSMGWI